MFIVDLISVISIDFVLKVVNLTNIVFTFYECCKAINWCCFTHNIKIQFLWILRSTVFIYKCILRQYLLYVILINVVSMIFFFDTFCFDKFMILGVTLDHSIKFSTCCCISHFDNCYSIIFQLVVVLFASIIAIFVNMVLIIWFWFIVPNAKFWLRLHERWHSILSITEFGGMDRNM